MKNRSLSAAFVKSLFVPRADDSNKGDFGHVLVLAGSRGMTGAGVLCANAALRSGAGLVTLGMPEAALAAAHCRLRPEIMTLPLPEGEYHSLNRSALPPVIDHINKRRVSALAIGPGLGNNADVAALVKAILAAVKLPVVLDADGLNVLVRTAGGTPALGALRDSKASIVVTPHPGEFARLTGRTVEQVQANRGKNAAAFARDNKAVCVLKGRQTVITDGNDVFINTTGNPGMATGGAGDVLTGMIAAFVAQMRAPLCRNAALAAVYLHGLAGDIAARSLTEIALTAGDIIDTLPKALQTIE